MSQKKYKTSSSLSPISNNNLLHLCGPIDLARAANSLLTCAGALLQASATAFIALIAPPPAALSSLSVGSFSLTNSWYPERALAGLGSLGGKADFAALEAASKRDFSVAERDFHEAATAAKRCVTERPPSLAAPLERCSLTKRA